MMFELLIAAVTSAALVLAARWVKQEVARVENDVRRTQRTRKAAR